MRFGAGLAALLTGWVWLDISAAAQSTASSAYSFTTLAGHFPGNGSRDGVGSDAVFSFPMGVALDPNGNVYVADGGNNEIRQITPAGLVTTIAGLAGSSFAGANDGIASGSNDGPGSAARFYNPWGLVVDRAHNVYVADTYNSTIRKITPQGTNWLVTTIAGQAGNRGYADGTGTNALFSNPTGIAVDGNGNLYTTDNAVLRQIVPTGTNWVVTTIAGMAYVNGSNDGTNSAARFIYPFGVVVDSSSNVYVVDLSAGTIRKVRPSGTNWVVTTLSTVTVSFGSVTPVQLNQPEGIALDAQGNFYVGSSGDNTIQKLTPAGTNWLVTTLAGAANVEGAADLAGTNAGFNFPTGVAVDTNGNVYVADTDNSKIRVVTSAGQVNTYAGAGNIVTLGSINGTGASALFSSPSGVALDPAGNVYVGDGGDFLLRKITPLGEVSTVAGLAGSFGHADGVGSLATFSNIRALARDAHGNLFVSDSENCLIRKVTPASVVTTIAGMALINGTNDGVGTNAQFNYPQGIALDTNANLYVADSQSHTIRMITPAGVVSTIAGAPSIYGSADGTNSNAEFRDPTGVALDAAGHLFVSDFTCIREVVHSGTNWIVTTIAGSLSMGAADGMGTNAQFAFLTSIATDGAGNLYVTDQEYDTVRKISPSGSNWVVTTIGGRARTAGSIDGLGTVAQFHAPAGVAADGAGNVYVADTDNNTIRKGAFEAYTAANPVPYTPPAMNAQLVVTLLPPEAGGQWRFPWETAWRNSGQAASNLVAGNYTVEFRAVPGFLALPASLTNVPVTNSGITFLTNLYYATDDVVDTNSGGTLTVNIGPSPPPGAGWRFLGDIGPYYPPGYTTNLLSGTYLLQFAPVNGFTQPPNEAVQVDAGLPTVESETYTLAQTPPANVLLPVPVPANEIGDLTDYPFGFNGQLQSDVGYGSGVAVQTNVVLTAAHLVFNDQDLDYVSQVYWFYQEEAGQFAPEPLQARGWYLLSGYAAQRTNDVLGGLGPDQSSPQSRNLDVAAIYFQTPVANGGYGGFLPSDQSPNQWLTSGAQKMLVGYPVDGSLFGDASIVPGQMYQTAPQPTPLILAADPVTNEQVYTAPWFLGYPGDSGGPLYVQYNGYYYPAGVYLGTLFSGTVPQASAVRAIDSNVVSLITLATSLGDSGTNYSGGGVITVVPNATVSARHPGYLILQLGPPAAVQAGAAWELAGQPTNYYLTANPSAQEIISTNAFAVQFRPVPGWNLPTNRSVTVISGVIITNVANYTVTNPVLAVDPVNGLRISGTSNTSYQIQSNSTLGGGVWVPIKTNTLTNAGFNLITNRPGPGFYRALWLTN
jgi:hypothetical protein